MTGAGKPDLAELRIDHAAREPRRMPWLVVSLVVAAVVAAAAVAGVMLTSGGAVEVRVEPARPAAASEAVAVLNASGYVTPRRRSTVAAKITGRVTEVLVDEGMKVHQGQVLARLDDADARARFEASRAERDVAQATRTDLEVNLENAQKTLARISQLRHDGVASQADLDDAETAVSSLQARLGVAVRQLAAAEAQLQVAAQDLENYTIRAPFSGIAVSKDAQPGEIVSPVSAGGGFTRTGISTIVDMSSLEIEVDVNESFIARVVPGQRVEAVLDAYPEWRIPARVRTVIPTADRQRATVKVRITFDQLDPRILPDMGVKVSFLESDSGSPAATAARALVPSAAVRTLDGRTVVFVLDGEHLTRRGVSLGRERGSEIEVLAGVKPGELVVVGGPAELADGQAARRVEGGRES